MLGALAATAVHHWNIRRYHYRHLNLSHGQNLLACQADEELVDAAVSAVSLLESG
jgi:hypothetical protein